MFIFLVFSCVKRMKRKVQGSFSSSVKQEKEGKKESVDFSSLSSQMKKEKSDFNSNFFWFRTRKQIQLQERNSETETMMIVWFQQYKNILAAKTGKNISGFFFFF